MELDLSFTSSSNRSPCETKLKHGGGTIMLWAAFLQDDLKKEQRFLTKTFHRFSLRMKPAGQ